jgi:hypothetical protein
MSVVAKISVASSISIEKVPKIIGEMCPSGNIKCELYSIEYGCNIWTLTFPKSMLDIVKNNIRPCLAPCSNSIHVSLTHMPIAPTSDEIFKITEYAINNVVLGLEANKLNFDIRIIDNKNLYINYSSKTPGFIQTLSKIHTTHIKSIIRTYLDEFVQIKQKEFINIMKSTS